MKKSLSWKRLKMERWRGIEGNRELNLLVGAVAV